LYDTLASCLCQNACLEMKIYRLSFSFMDRGIKTNRVIEFYSIMNTFLGCLQMTRDTDCHKKPQGAACHCHPIFRRSNSIRDLPQL
jgi:hypothetical protein